jgi:hypothetical protein
MTDFAGSRLVLASSVRERHIRWGVVTDEPAREDARPTKNKSAQSA